jgi:hypothetical protein
LDQDINFPFVPTCSVGAITAESSNVVYSTMEVNGNAESFNISLNCESGASLYLFECDNTPICATRERCPVPRKRFLFSCPPGRTFPLPMPRAPASGHSMTATPLAIGCRA